MLRQLFGAFLLMSLQGASLMLTAVGGVFSSAGSMMHIVFVRAATRYDNKYAIKPADIDKDSSSPSLAKALN